jgi:hypothetical protein
MLYHFSVKIRGDMRRWKQLMDLFNSRKAGEIRELTGN